MKLENSLSDVITTLKKLLNRQERMKLIILIFLLISINLIDLVGVGLLGLVGTIAISGIQSSESPAIASSILSFLGIQGFTFQSQVAILATIATALLTSRTFISLYLSKKTFFYFARKSAELSGKIVSKIFDDGLQQVKTKSIQQIVFTTTAGCDILMIGAVAQSINLMSDIALLVIIGSGILVIQPTTAIISFVIFGMSGFIMHKVFNRKARVLGELGAQQTIEANALIDNLFTSYREVFVRNTSAYYIQKIQKARQRASNTQAEVIFLPVLNKHFLESTLIFGALIVAAIQFWIQDAYSAIIALAIFLAAGSRLVPALLRVQQGLLNIRNSIGGSSQTLAQIDALSSIDFIESPVTVTLSKDGFVPELEIRNVNFKYANNENQILKNINLSIKRNSMFAVTGPSGSGKTTLIDLILGILQPTSGAIFVSGIKPREAIKTWPGAISYVPQDIYINSGSFLSNIATGISTAEIDRDQVVKVCEMAQLTDVLLSLPDGLETIIGTPGISLSGGQKQRIGIARALYSNPKLIVLDEPTSSLDSDTEKLIADALKEINKSTTIILIAHRLSTLRNVNTICYLENGQVKALGTLAEVRKLLPNFDLNAKIMGLEVS
jgi:ABC-type multidrug transport system fused ATPase/permease subunit